MTVTNNKIAFLFPGQGSQRIGMGKNLYNQHKIAKEVFEKIDEKLEFKLSEIIFNGPESELKKTENTQPALMAVSVALSKVIEHESNIKFNKIASLICGHSLGEYSALCATNVISIEDACSLLRIRGLAMKNAVSSLSTKMVAILGIDIADIEDIILQNKNDLVCDVANDNCPGQVVLSGHTEKVDLISEKCIRAGAKKSIQLNVSAPFHCELMKPAADEMEKALEKIKFNDVEIKFVSNYDAKIYSKNDLIKNLLIKQICSKVRWRESIKAIKNFGLTYLYEIGSGKVLSGLNKRMNLSLNTGNIENMNDIEKFLISFTK